MVNCREVIAILTDDAFLKVQLPGMINTVRMYFRDFFCALRLLMSLVVDLPKHHLGKNVRHERTFRWT